MQSFKFSDEQVSLNKVKSLSNLHSLTPILFGASAFQYLNAGCELGLFELLNTKGKLTKAEIAKKLNLQTRAIDILLLGTTSLKLTELKDEYYFNSNTLNYLFQENIWDIFKDVVAFEQHIAYLAQFDLTESLRKNKNIGLQRVPGQGRDLYHRLAENPYLQEVFYKYMDSWTRLTNQYLFNHVDFSTVRSLLDVGGGTGINAIALAKENPALKATILEIASSAPVAIENIRRAGLSNRVGVHAGDMFAMDFPKGHDLILFSHQLVIWTPEENIILLKKAYDALTTGGKVVIFNSISNDDDSGPLMAALDSVYFAALPAEGGMIYPWKQYVDWLSQVGFKNIKRSNCHAWTPHGVIQAYK
ncbi:MAG: methyltransferase [Pseudomonadota bacterium]